MPLPIKMLFQSLFYWIWLSKTYDPASAVKVTDSFNPYSTGFGSLRSSINMPLPIKMLFQSLFYWIWLSKFATANDFCSLICVSILILLDLAL